MRRRDFAVVLAGQFAGLAVLEAGLCAVPVALDGMGAAGAGELAGWLGASQFACGGLAIVSIPLWGRLSDRYGRVPLLARAQAGLALSLAVMALAREPWQIVAARAFQGAFAGVTPAAFALAAGGTPGPVRLGWLQSAGLAGAVAGPLAAVVLLGRVPASVVLGWGALACLALAVATASVAEPPREERASEPRPRPRESAEAAALAFFRSIEDPLLPVLARSLVPGSWTGLLGAALAASRAVQALAAPWWGRLCAAFGPDAVLPAVALGAGLATAAQALAPTPATLLAARAALGFCAAGVVAALYARAARHAARRGESVARTASAMRLGGALAGGASGALAAALGAPGALILAGAGLAATARLSWRESKVEDACVVSCSTGT